MKKTDLNTLNWKEIGQRFKEFRNSTGLNQSEMEKRAGKSGGLAKFEAGITPASTNYALFLRNSFGASFDWLYDGVVIDRKYEDIQKKKSVFDPPAIGERLKSVRLSKGLNKEEFGKTIGVAGKTIAQYEAGMQKPEMKSALKIKRALNKPLDWIYFGDEYIMPRGGQIQTKTEPKPIIPLKQVRKELKETIMTHIKRLDTNELALLATRLRMENRFNTTNEKNATTTGQHNTVSQAFKTKSSD